MQDPSPTPRHRNPLLALSFAALLVLTSVAFATTGAGYVAREQAKGETFVVATVMDAHLDESNDRVVVEVEVDNPTLRPVVVDTANVDGLVDDTSVARGSSSVEETVPAGESKTITLELSIRDDHREAAVEAVESDSMEFGGTLWSRIERFRFQVSVGGESA